MSGRHTPRDAERLAALDAYEAALAALDSATAALDAATRSRAKTSAALCPLVVARDAAYARWDAAEQALCATLRRQRAARDRVAKLNG